MIFQFMAQHPNFADTDLSSLRILICGAAPCPELLLKTWETRGVPIQQGLTETALSKISSSGRPLLFTEVKLVNVDGKPVSEPRVKARFLRVGPM